MFRPSLICAALCLLAACTPQSDEAAEEPAVVEQEEPTPEPEPTWSDPPSDDVVPGDEDWAVESWTRLPEGIAAPDLDALLGKVVVIFCFQHW